MSFKKAAAAVLECYRRMYKEATPSADFDKLVEEAPLNERGDKVIDYNSYTLSMKRMDAIIEEVIKEFKIKPFYRQSIRLEVTLGCGPKSSRDE